MLRHLYCPALGLLVAGAVSGAQQSNVTLSPFVNFLPVGNAQPMAGMAFTVSDGFVALRFGGQMSPQRRAAASTQSSTAVTRLWAADADALVQLENLSYGDLLTFSPYVFVGASAFAADSGAVRINRPGWSYGSGLSLPLGSVVEMLGEFRWRMSRFVSPQASDAPRPAGEARFGIAFRVGGRRAEHVIVPAGDAVSDGTRSHDMAARVISTAAEYLGAPYRRGGSSPSTGFDAAGFVRFVFGQLGVILPRRSRDQARLGEQVREDWHVIAPGDLLLFEDDDGINHVAIYVGRNRIIHATEPGGGVLYDDLKTERGRWFLEHLVTVRRVTPNLRGLLLDLAREVPSEDSQRTDEPDRAPRIERKRRGAQRE